MRGQIRSREEDNVGQSSPNPKPRQAPRSERGASVPARAGGAGPAQEGWWTEEAAKVPLEVKGAVHKAIGEILSRRDDCMLEECYARVAELLSVDEELVRNE